MISNPNYSSPFLSTIVECGPFWQLPCMGLFEIFALSPYRCHLRALIRTTKTERWINSLVPVFNLQNEDEALATMKRFIHCDPNHPRLIELC